MSNVEMTLATMDLTDKQKDEIRTAIKSQKSRRKVESDYAKYPNIVAGSLGFDSVANKQFVTITCAEEGCDETRRTFTSDLHQVSRCLAHVKAGQKAKRAEKREAFKRFQAAQAELSE